MARRTAVERGGLVVVDEIGRMELASDAFVAAVNGLMDSSVPVVAAVPVRPHPFTDALKQRKDVELFKLTAENRDRMPHQLLTRLTRAPVM